MRISCPFCGDRDAHEFSYLGEAGLTRPDPAAVDTFHDYVYLRRNPAGAHRDLWYHANGCRRWVVVARDTLTHEITNVTFATGAGEAG